jgi:hypothetical protein
LRLRPIANFVTDATSKCVAQYVLDSGVGSAMKKKNRISEREYQRRLKSCLLKGAFNTQPQPLRSLKTATKKRRVLKMKATERSVFTKSSTTASG